MQLLLYILNHLFYQSQEEFWFFLHGLINSFLKDCLYFIQKVSLFVDDPKGDQVLTQIPYERTESTTGLKFDHFFKNWKRACTICN